MRRSDVVEAGEDENAAMPIPDFQSLMLPVLRQLGLHRRTTTELVEAMAEEHRLAEEERRALLPSGRQTVIANRRHWALSYLNRAGLITRVACQIPSQEPAGSIA